MILAQFDALSEFPRDYNRHFIDFQKNRLGLGSRPNFYTSGETEWSGVLSSKHMSAGGQQKLLD